MENFNKNTSRVVYNSFCYDLLCVHPAYNSFVIVVSAFAAVVVVKISSPK